MAITEARLGDWEAVVNPRKFLQHHLSVVDNGAACLIISEAPEKKDSCRQNNMDSGLFQ